VERECVDHLNLIWLSGVLQGYILVYFTFEVIVGKAFAENSRYFQQKPFPQKHMLGFMWLMDNTRIHLQYSLMKYSSKALLYSVTLVVIYFSGWFNVL